MTPGTQRARTIHELDGVVANFELTVIRRPLDLEHNFLDSLAVTLETTLFSPKPVRLVGSIARWTGSPYALAA